MDKKDFALYQKSLFEACHKIAIKKGNDYARGDDPFLNFRASETIGVKPIRGILIRIMDKIQRLNNYGVVGKLDNESAEDAVMDIINYASLIGGLICEQEGKKTPNDVIVRGHSESEQDEGDRSSEGGIYWSTRTNPNCNRCGQALCNCGWQG